MCVGCMAMYSAAMALVQLGMERFEFANGWGQVHESGKCAGETCVIHNPSRHHMRYWPRWLEEPTAYVSRVCSHGFHHPDPDATAFSQRFQGELPGFVKRHRDGAECDGCCVPPAEVPMSIIIRDLLEVEKATR